ncbi:MAG: YraN family protein [Polyangiaceae bacterium]|nr:YraN family protein [Polyangiaceae bacterium]
MVSAKERRSPAEADARHVLGRRAEEAAASYLEASGFVVLQRNVRVGRLEIDIVARDGPVIAIVEVRTRSEGAWIKALDSVDWRKRKRVRAAGESLWRTRFRRDATIERMRFDVVSVFLEPNAAPRCEHVRAAF